MVPAKFADDVAPQRTVHRQPVQQHDDGAVASGVLVPDSPCSELYLGHDPSPHAEVAGRAGGVEWWLAMGGLSRAAAGRRGCADPPDWQAGVPVAA
jgi:hypothetical protein